MLAYICIHLNLSQCEAQYIKNVMIEQNHNKYFWKKVYEQVDFLMQHQKGTNAMSGTIILADFCDSNERKQQSSVLETWQQDSHWKV